MKTAIVILNWNTKDFLKRFLPPLLDSVRNSEGTEVIVADNASEDGSLEMMKEEFPEVRTLAFDKNYGFTGGYNKAFAEIESDLFLLLNSDIEVTEGWIEPLIAWMESHPECGACAPKLHSWQERNMFEYAGAAGGLLDKWGYPFCKGRVMNMLEEDKGQYDSESEAFWASGAALMVRSAAFKEMNGLDERFFAHMEEIDLCWRMQLAGWRVNIVPESTIYHVGGGTLPSTSPFKLFLNFRNNLLMLDNNQAATYALDLFKDGSDIKTSARKGIRKGKRLICFRKLLNILSAAVYAGTFRFKYAEAVLKAHKDFNRLRKPKSAKNIEDFLEKCADKARVYGRYDKWIVWQALTKKNKVFKDIKQKMI